MPAISQLSPPLDATSRSERSHRTTGASAGTGPHPRHASRLPPDRDPRDPVDRAFSWYQYSRRNGDEQRSFERFVEEDPTAVEYGLYHKHLSRYWELVPGHAFKALIYEDLIADPLREAQALASFLGLSRSFPDPIALFAEQVNTGPVPRHRGAFAFARRVGGYLMWHDVNWPARMAKRLGVREWFGSEGGVAALDPSIRNRVGARFLEDTIRLGKSLDRNMADVWRLDRAAESAP